VTDEYAGYNRSLRRAESRPRCRDLDDDRPARRRAPVVGRNHGATGGVVYLTFLKLF